MTRNPALHPLLATAFFGAMNDNLLRAALVVLATLLVPASQAALIALLASGLMMLPYLLVSGLAGRLADKREKAGLIRWIKAAELAIACLASAALLAHSLPFLLVVIFAMGTHSAFYGPLKQGWLPERLPAADLVPANALLETATFAAILLGTLGGGALMALWGAPAVATASVLIALAGIAASLRLPTGQPAAPALHIPANPFSGNITLLQDLAADRGLMRAALLESWFWAAGAVYLSALPVFLRGLLDADQLLVSTIMAVFAAGIGAGSLLIARLLRGKPSLTSTAPSALLLALGGLVLYAALLALPARGGTAALFTTPSGIVTTLSILAVAMAGGAYAVPLAAAIQTRSPPDARARIQAGKGILSAAAITATSLLMALLTTLGLPLSAQFLILATGSATAFAATLRFFPAEALQGLLRLLLGTLLRVKITGGENLNTTGPVIYASNHQSLLDGPLLFSLLGPQAAFAMTSIWADRPFMQKVARLVPILATDHTKPMSIKAMARRIAAGQSCVIFPEGRITATGALMKIYPGTSWLVDQANVPVIPIHIEGLEFSRQSRPKHGFPRRWFPKVRLTIGPAQRITLDPDLKGRKRRERAALMVSELLETQRYIALNRYDTLPQALADTAALYGANRSALVDHTGTDLSHGKLTLAGDVLARTLSPLLKDDPTVGLLLPTAAGVPAVLLALWRMGVTPAMLNPTLGPGPLKTCLTTAQITTVITSTAMVDQAKLHGLIADLEAAGIRILRTEDIRASVTIATKARAFLSAKFGPARKGSTLVPITRDTPAAILFTSGTEGAPKGVVLSHANFLANIAQLRAHTDVNAGDRIFTALPVFHSFGLTAGILLPLVVGAQVVAYPSPLHYKVIPELAYYHQPTVIFGTDSFLSGWGRRAHDYDFASLRTAIAGAEPIKQATRDLWSRRFGVRILEGYGATETAPVLSLNTPVSSRDGTVGRFLPGIEPRLEPITGVDAFKLYVRGENIMRGYIRATAPGVIEAPEDGWYDTGDAVTLDDDGFITIRGRIKRFAKIGGEMVSLAAVEALSERTWPNIPAAAIAQPDPRKGNRVILVLAPPHGEKAPTLDALKTQARAEGMAEIMLPARLELLAKLPMLASGKPDYPAIAKLYADP
ncbi:acyl-[ACP]--phospholipid O-acyltransferase [Gemmobacter aquarius]|uniref:Acyl-[ACP]--phospholipid O-acyltransferase n=1 Tax=Paragemmobacter aquarius TaxID=2169400 RepID=A0A2S0UK37_9RHOB|nr:MFS transporter [Gemmobacter aquarius]AWB48161.1 acyl-[ACP]--phospholipid O-acyltransferase [Gemmobacter aquarius]